VLEAEGKAQAVIVKAKAQAEALTKIEKALHAKGGLEAAEFLMGQRYISAYQNLGRKSNSLLLETEPNNVAGQISDSMNLVNFNKPSQ